MTPPTITLIKSRICVTCHKLYAHHIPEDDGQQQCKKCRGEAVTPRATSLHPLDYDVIE